MARYSIRLSSLTLLIVAAPFLANANLQAHSHVEPSNTTLHQQLTGLGFEVAAIDRTATRIEVSVWRDGSGFSLSLDPHSGHIMTATQLASASGDRFAHH